MSGALRNAGLIGREAELARLSAVLLRALDGAGSVVVLSGDAGVGKSRLAEEVASFGRQRGAVVAWTRCYDDEATPWLWPWVELLRQLIAEVVPGPALAELLSVVPVLGVASDNLIDPAAGDPPTSDPSASRFRLARAVNATLSERARRSPVVLVLDDLQWADRASLVLFEHVSRALGSDPILVVVTVRSESLAGDGAVADALGRVLSATDATTIELGGLSRDESERLLANVLDDSLARSLAPELHARTEGNALFLVEMARMLRNGGPGREPQRVLPTSVRQLIRQRVSGLTTEVTDLLSIAAVAGREFAVELLQVASGLGVDAILDRLEVAEQAQLIVEGGTSGSFRFAHPLFREAMIADLSVVRRARVHRLVADALVTVRHDDLGPALGDIAFHYGRSASTGTAALTVDYAERAAERCVRLHAFDDAATNYELALAYATEPVHRVELQLRLGETLNTAGELTRALQAFEQAAAGARELRANGPSIDGARLLARAAVGSSTIVVAVERLPERARLIDEAIHALSATATNDPSDAALRIDLQVRLAGSLAYTTECERRDELLDSALDSAEQLAMPSVLIGVLSVRSLAAWRLDDLRHRLQTAERMRALAVACGDRNLLIEAQRLRVVALLDAGDVTALDAALEDHASMSNEGFGVHRWRAGMWKTMRLLVDGRFAEAERSMTEAREITKGVGHPDEFLWYAAQTLQMYRDTGRLEVLEDSVRSLVVSAPGLPLWRTVLTALLAETGRLDESRDHLDQLVADLSGTADVANPFEKVLPLAEGLASAMLIADTVSIIGDTKHVALLYDALLPYAAHGVMAGPAVVFVGCVAHRLATLAARNDDAEFALRHYELARVRYERMGARPWLARLFCDRAADLLRVQPADSAGAALLLAQSKSIADDIAMTGLATKLADLTAAVETALHRTAANRRHREPAPVTKDDQKRYASLSDREREVLRLIAAGYNNPEIASALLIASKTVMHHAASIYRKLGVRGRAEAAAFMTRVESNTRSDDGRRR